MKYDCFYFLNELDMLEMRLNILDPYVDFFVLSEATETFSGFPKPLYYQENKERFKKWEHKIIHNVVSDYPNDIKIYFLAKTSPNVGKGEHWWVREFYQKESIKKALTGLKDNDVCYVSDVDEIWRPELNFEVKDAIYKPRQVPYLYYLNQRTDENWLGWNGTIVTKYKNIRDGVLNHLKTDSLTQFEVIEKGGWHFCALEGIEGRNKAHQHPTDSTPAFLKRKEINMRKDETGLPEYLLTHREQWKKYFM